MFGDVFVHLAEGRFLCSPNWDDRVPESLVKKEASVELFIRVLSGRFGGERQQAPLSFWVKSQVRQPVSGSYCCVTSCPQPQWF